MDSPDMQRVSLYLPRKLVQEADRTKENAASLPATSSMPKPSRASSPNSFWRMT